ncbi:MAG: hypothetical protein ABR584_07910 [Candidatus Baltobacteraceae bacterium]
MGATPTLGTHDRILPLGDISPVAKILLAGPALAALSLLAMPAVQAHNVRIPLAAAVQNDLLVQSNDDSVDEIDGQYDNAQSDDTIVAYNDDQGTDPQSIDQTNPTAQIGQIGPVINNDANVQEDGNNGPDEEQQRSR